jgi:hypothetical protein
MLTASAGCGRPTPPWGPVSGQVLYLGKPAQHVVVLFSNPGIGVEMTAVTDEQGQFRLATAKVPGLPTGEYRVAVFPALYDQPIDGMMFPKPDKSKPGMTLAPDIPLLYRDVATSGLTAQVTTGHNDFRFDLKSDSKPLPN